jgi:hypothetical protein
MHWARTRAARRMPRKVAVPDFACNVSEYHLLNSNDMRVRGVLSATIHRKWAREFLVRAQQVPSRRRALRYLQLAVSNTMKAEETDDDGKTE